MIPFMYWFLVWVHCSFDAGCCCNILCLETVVLPVDEVMYSTCPHCILSISFLTFFLPYPEHLVGISNLHSPDCRLWKWCETHHSCRVVFWPYPLDVPAIHIMIWQLLYTSWYQHFFHFFVYPGNPLHRNGSCIFFFDEKLTFVTDDDTLIDQCINVAVSLKDSFVNVLKRSWRFWWWHHQ